MSLGKNTDHLFSRRGRTLSGLSLVSALMLLGGCASAGTVSSSGAQGHASEQKSAASTSQTSSQQSSQSQSSAGFRGWIERFRPYALSHGISATTFDRAFRNAHVQRSILNLSSSQPEFTRRVWQYLDTAVSSTRVAKGKQLMSRYQSVLDKAQRQYGVPPHIIVAIWGMESNYGANFGNYPTLDALATLGYSGHREAWAKGELVQALKIIQNGDIDPDHMRGSWAGAMGNTQFMPSAFNQYAVDGDGDGRRDIWGSIPDVVASTANYLEGNGWRRNEPWGTEVTLPSGFNYALANGKLRHSSSEWQRLGVRPAEGGQLPQLADATLILPAGANGPAFLAGHNFRTILRYNNSTSYALGVSLLGQRIEGGGGVKKAWPRSESAVSRTSIKQLQSRLTSLGYDAGGVDGIAGSGTISAVRQFQRAHGLPADGFVTNQLVQRVLSTR